MKNFESFLAPQLKEFVAYRQNLGYATKTLLSHLKTFDRYIKKKKAEPDLLQPIFFLELRADLKMEPKSVNRVLYAVSAFFKFLVRKGLYKENPLTDIPRLKKHAFIPFIFSPEEIDQLLNVISKKIRKIQRYFLTDFGVYLAIVLMARCGLRISETLRLLQRHYRSDEKTLYIEKTKFKKDRLIPIPIPVANQIDNYLAARNILLGENQNPYLLAGHKQNKLGDNRVRFVFHQAVKDIGIDKPRRVIADTIFAHPTPHSLRHSFAVNTLKSVKARGTSPQNALPVLAFYMGHSEYKHTTKYLKFIDARQRQRLTDFVISQKEDI